MGGDVWRETFFDPPLDMRKVVGQTSTVDLFDMGDTALGRWPQLTLTGKEPMLSMRSNITWPALTKRPGFEGDRFAFLPNRAESAVRGCALDLHGAPAAGRLRAT